MTSTQTHTQRIHSSHPHISFPEGLKNTLTLSSNSWTSLVFTSYRLAENHALHRPPEMILCELASLGEESVTLRRRRHWSIDDWNKYCSYGKPVLECDWVWVGGVGFRYSQGIVLMIKLPLVPSSYNTSFRCVVL